MLPERYLILGLDALSRAHATDYFADGHRGAAIISAYLLCRECDVGDGAASVIADLIDEHWTHTDLCAPFPDERPDPASLERLLTALGDNVGHLRQVGHNVIFASLALKAFRQFPDAITPSRVDGMCRLIQAFDFVEDIDLGPDDRLPDFDDDQAFAEFILRETLRTMEVFCGRGQGWSGHMLTFGRALMDLRQLGYAELARRGQHAFAQYVKRTRMGPLDTDKPRPEHSRSHLLPTRSAYWQARRANPVGIGHCFKYPYGFYGLVALASDEELTRRCAQEAYRIF
ncbi:MAG: hypothetical protein ACE5O2_07010 [Armatimonadota bacterium]